MDSEVFSLNSKSEQAKILNKYFSSFQKSYVDATGCVSRLRSAMQKSVAPRQLHQVTNFLSAVYLPWTEIVETFIEYKIKSLDTQDQVRKITVRNPYYTEGIWIIDKYGI